ADHDAERALVVEDGLGGVDAERRVVVVGGVVVGPVVDGLVTVLGEPGDEVVLEFVAGVIGTEVDAHAAILAGAVSCGPSACGPSRAPTRRTRAPTRRPRRRRARAP